MNRIDCLEVAEIIDKVGALLVRTGRVDAVEALLRWQHEGHACDRCDQGFVYPRHRPLQAEAGRTPKYADRRLCG